MSDTISSLLEESRASGWAEGVLALPSSGDVETEFARMIDFQVSMLHYGAALNRPGEPRVSILEPVTQEEAHPASISAQVGLNQQPLHTDGAHLRKVPDVVLLWSAGVSATTTRIWSPLAALRTKYQDGIFVVSSGADKWFAPAIEGSNVRFDPVCMSPCDSKARRLFDFMQSPPEGEVREIEWNAPGKVVVIRNRRILHGRSAIVPGDEDRRIGRAAYYAEGPE